MTKRSFAMYEQNPLENLIRLSSRPESYSWCTCSANICKILGGRVAWQLPGKPETPSNLASNVQAEKYDEIQEHSKPDQADKGKASVITSAIAQAWTRGDGGYGAGSSWKDVGMTFMGGLGTGIKMLMVGKQMQQFQ
jgi:hypothetical protein